MTHVDPIEKKLFMDGIFMRYGYDFRDYSDASLNRRLSYLMVQTQSQSLLEVLVQALKSSDHFRSILPMMTVGTTEFFRDPSFFKSLREQVFPILKTYPSIRVWIAGCSTGEEAVSLAILLKEENLLQRTTIYATDINPEVLVKAKSGIYSTMSLKTFAKNYAAASGLRTPSEYYTSDYGAALINPDLRSNIVYTEHNLATDSVFTEAHLILCRNVMIYFNRELQCRAFDLFSRSLVKRGFLGIGSKESIRFSSVANEYEAVNESQHIHRLKGVGIS